MSPPSFIKASSVFTLCLGFLLIHAAEPQKEGFTEQFYGSAENMDLILRADTVTACRLKVPRREDGKIDGQKVRDETLKHYEAEAAIEVPAKARDDLQQILKDPAIQYTGPSKSCVPIYGVRFSFTRKGKTLAVNLCFLCDILVTTDAETIIGGGSYVPASERLLAIAQSLFPADDDLKGIR